MLLTIQNCILQAKLKPLFSTKAFLLKHSLSSQNILIIPSSLTLHSYRHNSTIDLGRIFKIPYIINIPYHANPHRNLHLKSLLLVFKMQNILQIYQNLFIQTLSNHLLQLHQPFQLLPKTSKTS